MPARVSALTPWPFLALVAGVLASPAACVPGEPPKIATVSTEVPVSSASVGAPANSAAPEQAPPADSSAAAAGSAPSAPATTGDARAGVKPDELAELDMKVLEALNGSSSTAGALQLAPGSGPSDGGIGAGPTAPAATAPRVKGPVVAVTVAPPTVLGGNVVNAAPMAQGMAPGFRHCLNLALGADPISVSTGASATVTAAIDPSGAVTSASASRSRGISAAALTCIVERVKMTSFAPPDTGTAKITISMTVQVQ